MEPNTAPDTTRGARLEYPMLQGITILGLYGTTWDAFNDAAAAAQSAAAAANNIDEHNNTDPQFRTPLKLAADALYKVVVATQTAGTTDGGKTVTLFPVDPPANEDVQEFWFPHGRAIEIDIRGGQGRLIVQADVPPPIRGEAAHQRGLAALARAVDHHHGSIRKRDCHLPGGMARNEGIVGWWHGVSRRFGRRPIRIVCPSNPDYKAVHSGSSRIRLGLVAIITEQQIFEPTGATVPERLRPEPGDTR